jgi:mRNA interferase MazF
MTLLARKSCVSSLVSTNGRSISTAGTICDVATPGDYGKPRPALVVQSDLFAELPSVVICPLTTTVRTDADLFRLDVKPSEQNGLRELSQVAIDKITVVPAAKIGRAIGTADDALLLRVNRALALFLGIV